MAVLNAIAIIIVTIKVRVQVHKVPEARVQNSVAEPVQWARAEQKPRFSNRKHEVEKRDWKGRKQKQKPG